MKNTSLIYGYTDIKLHLIEKCRIKKPAYEIVLWFSERDNEVYVHDRYNHESSTIIALKLKDRWLYYLNQNSLGDKTVRYYVNQLSAAQPSLSKAMNEGYDLLGYFSGRRR
jgi:hypothetical protein